MGLAKPLIRTIPLGALTTRAALATERMRTLSLLFGQRRLRPHQVQGLDHRAEPVCDRMVHEQQECGPPRRRLPHDHDSPGSDQCCITACGPCPKFGAVPMTPTASDPTTLQGPVTIIVNGQE